MSIDVKVEKAVERGSLREGLAGKLGARMPCKDNFIEVEMSRVAVFVDAGYFFAQVLKLLGDDRSSRDQLEVDYGKMRESFLAEARQQFPRSELLRIYWYDGPGVNGKTHAHKMIDELDDFKLRLGSRNAMGQQKEVDGLIIADMITLVNNKAIGDAILVSGDADIIPGVTVVQALGARVHVLSVGAAELVSSGAGYSMSPHLAAEADRKADWAKERVRGFASVRLCPAAAAELREACEQARAAEQAKLETGQGCRPAEQECEKSEPAAEGERSEPEEARPAPAPPQRSEAAKPADFASQAASQSAKQGPRKTSRSEYIAMVEGFIEKMISEGKEHVLAEYGPSGLAGSGMPRMLPKNLDGQFLFYGKTILGRILDGDDKRHLRDQLRLALIARLERGGDGNASASQVAGGESVKAPEGASPPASADEAECSASQDDACAQNAEEGAANEKAGAGDGSACRGPGGEGGEKIDGQAGLAWMEPSYRLAKPLLPTPLGWLVNMAISRAREKRQNSAS